MDFKIDIQKQIGQLITLKRRMGIPDDVYGQLFGLSGIEQKQLETDGIVVSPDDIETADDYTLTYKGERVVLYIRDVNNYSGHENDPRFHIAQCSTLNDMFAKNRKHRYVISQREDGLFTLNYHNSTQTVEKQLQVCQHCLDLLEYNGFYYRNPYKEDIIQNFSITEFFIQYPKNPYALSKMGHHMANTAPRNKYPENWSKITQETKEKYNYTCQECHIALNRPHHRKFIHVHHKDGNKANCSPYNLQVLCMHCHANQPFHSHMKRLDSYQKFIQLIYSSFK